MMKDILLKDLLEAGCHFGHKVEKWHPKAKSFIYQAKGGIHIIDLAQTRDGLKKAGEFVHNLAKEDKKILFVATKRQSKGIVSQAAKKAGCFYLTNRWIGGFITNWSEIRKNIDKILRYRSEAADGTWKKFPKHEVVKLEKELRKLEAIYGGVCEMLEPPDAVFIVDIKREISCLREAVRKNIPVVAIVDTNADPQMINYPIPANDDAVGSIRFVVDYLSQVILEGKNEKQKELDKEQKQKEKAAEPKEIKKEEESKEKEEVKNSSEIKETKKQPVKPEKKRGRPKKISSSET